MKVLASAATDIPRSVSPLRKISHVAAPFFLKHKNNNTNSIKKNP